MKSIIIDLHTHTKRDDRGISCQKTVDALYKRFNYENEKIFGITDHVKDIKSYKTYLEKLKKISNDKTIIDSKISIIQGFELSIYFNGNKDEFKHLIVLCKDDDSFGKIFDYILNNCENYQDDKIISINKFSTFFNEKNVDDYVFIPHGPGKHKCLNEDEINMFYDEIKTKLHIIEVPNNPSTWFYTSKKFENVQKSHIICCTDQTRIDDFSRLSTSFIYSDSNICPFNQLHQFFIQYDFYSHLSSSADNKYEFELSNSHVKIPYLNDDKYILENTLIYGERGSGKTYLADDLNSVLKNDSNKSKCCYIEQFMFHKKDNEIINDIFDKNLTKIKIDRIREFLVDKLNEMGLINSNDLHFVLKPAENFELFSQNIIENSKNPNILKNFIDKFNFRKNSEEINSSRVKFKNLHILSDKINELIDFINTKNTDKKWVIENFIDNDQKEGLLNQLIKINSQIEIKKSEFIKKMFFINKSVEITDELNNSAMKSRDWKWYFQNIDLSKAFKIKKIIEISRKILMNTKWKLDILDDKIKKILSEYCVISYRLKIKDEKDWNLIDDQTFYVNHESFKLVINDNGLEKTASGGQKREFYVFNTIFKCSKENNIDYLILDEADQSFDSKYILMFAKHIYDILKQNKWKLILITHNHILWSKLLQLGLRLSYLKTYIDDEGKHKAIQSYNLNKDEIFLNFEANEELYEYRGDKYGYRNKKQ